MADVINRATLEIRRSVHTPNFPTADWIVNPDLSALAGVPVRYWKVVGDTVVEMTTPEKDAVDAAVAAAKAAQELSANTDFSEALQVRNSARDAAALPVPPPGAGIIVCVHDAGGGSSGIAVSTEVGWLLFQRTGEV